MPDVDRTDHLLILGANPLVSNGSLLTAPDMRGRIRAIRERGGKVVVIDPRRSRTAREAVRAPLHPPRAPTPSCCSRSSTCCSPRTSPTRAISPSTPTAPSGSPSWPSRSRPRRSPRPCGIAAGEIRRMARELAAAERAAVYGRIGTTTQRFGTLASWLVDVINYLTGNLDREGGAMFPLAAVGQRNSAGNGPIGKGVARRALGEPGQRPARGLRRAARSSASPRRSRPRARARCGRWSRSPATRWSRPPTPAALEAAVETLDFMVSLDIYVNETTRHADVILPAPEPLAKAHYDFALYQLAVRSVANYSPPVLAARRGPARRVGDGAAPRRDRRRPGPRRRPRGLGRARRPDPDRPRGRRCRARAIEGRDAEEIVDGARRAPRARAGARLHAPRRARSATASAPTPTGSRWTKLEAAPHGIDLGPMRPRLPDVLRTPSGKIELAPEEIVADVPRLEAELAARRAAQRRTWS